MKRQEEARFSAQLPLYLEKVTVRFAVTETKGFALRTLDAQMRWAWIR